MKRGQKVALNAAFGLIEEFVAILSGFVLPRLILSAFGSQYNGLVTSITQFLSCAIIFRAGVGGAVRAALYKPLANKDKNEVDSIVCATDRYMKKIGAILGITIITLAAIYPLFVSEEYDWLFTFTLFLIIGASTFAEFFFGITYLTLLQADQKAWVASLIRSICYLLNLLVAVILIRMNCSIHVVKLGSTVIYVIYPIVQQMYVKHSYHINKHAKPDNKAISQRWDAFWQQIAIFVMNNTDVIVLTVFSDLLTVSVYSVYNLIVSGLRRAVQALSSGIEAPFGNMLAKGEITALRNNFKLVEFVFMSICTVLYTTSIEMIIPFVSLYTNGIEDVNYIRPIFAYVIMIAQFFNAIRLPYQMIVQAAGHYKQTKIGAIIEPILNISLSVLLVGNLGLIGVAIGTLAATIFRTVQYSIYMSRNLVVRGSYITFLKILLCYIEGAIAIIIINAFNFSEASTYFKWAIQAAIVVIISSIIVLLFALVFYRDELIDLVKRIVSLRK